MLNEKQAWRLHLSSIKLSRLSQELGNFQVISFLDKVTEQVFLHLPIQNYILGEVFFHSYFFAFCRAESWSRVKSMKKIWHGKARIRKGISTNVVKMCVRA